NIQSKIYGRKGYLRRRSVENVVAELTRAKSDSNPFLVRFSDDEFCYDAEWLEHFADVYPSRAGMPFWCFISPGSARPRQFAALKRAGCVEMQMGVQTLDTDVRRNVIDRHETTERIAEAIDTCRSMGIRLTVDFIMNLPGHDETRLVEAAGFFANHPPFRVHTFWLSYFPNLDITRYALDHGILTPAQMNEAWAGSSANTFFRGGTAFDPSLVRTQILFLLAALRMRPLVEWLTRNGRYRRIPFVGFALYWFLTYSASFATHEKKNDLFGKRMSRQYRSYFAARLRDAVASLWRPAVPATAGAPDPTAWAERP
ncbi:MAG: radical SAM protein, partial [Deltaproteobacteria bacterium]|nr:radical SAM protein [Deltaproteobacteria bacterium]